MSMKCHTLQLSIMQPPDILLTCVHYFLKHRYKQQNVANVGTDTLW